MVDAESTRLLWCRNTVLHENGLFPGQLIWPLGRHDARTFSGNVGGTLVDGTVYNQVLLTKRGVIVGLASQMKRHVVLVVITSFFILSGCRGNAERIEQDTGHVAEGCPGCANTPLALGFA